MLIKPVSEHRWLLQLVGDWSFISDCLMAPDQERQTFRGDEQVRPLGDIWIIAEGRTVTGEQVLQSRMTLGFDVVRNHFTGTWVDSMMPVLWVYHGFRDETGMSLVLESEGPSYEKEGRMTRYRDIITLENDNARSMRSFILLENGRWREFVVMSYQRK